jgi:hypothetical protein
MQIGEDDFQELSNVLAFLDGWTFDMTGKNPQIQLEADACHKFISSLIDRYIESEENDPRGALSTGSVAGSI